MSFYNNFEKVMVCAWSVWFGLYGLERCDNINSRNTKPQVTDYIIAKKEKPVRLFYHGKITDVQYLKLGDDYLRLVFVLDNQNLVLTNYNPDLEDDDRSVYNQLLEAKNKKEIVEVVVREKEGKLNLERILFTESDKVIGN